MRSSTWLRALAVVLALFAAGHTLGTAVPRVPHGAAQHAVVLAMQGSRFPVMGVERSYWDFYRGFALTISILLLVMSAAAWQSGAIGRRNPGLALPLAIGLQLGTVGLLIVSLIFFFPAPVVMSAAAALCSTVAVVLLAREAAVWTAGASPAAAHPVRGGAVPG